MAPKHDERMAELMRLMREVQGDILPTRQRPRSSPPAQGDRGARIDELAHEVSRKLGFKDEPNLRRKLEEACAHIPYAELEKRVRHYARLEPEKAEWLELAENLAVHETYFFRDRERMTRLRDHILRAVVERAAVSDKPHIRIWSAGCSRGAEAYSVAILLLEALLAANEAIERSPGDIVVASRWSLSVLGTDLSLPVLRMARDGIFSDSGSSAARSFPQQYERFFDRLTPGFENEGGTSFGSHRCAKEVLRKIVRFEPHNLMSAAPPGGDFDVVLCRYVLGSFEEAAVEHVQQVFWQALRPDGILILGESEALPPSGGFRALEGESATYFKI